MSCLKTVLYVSQTKLDILSVLMNEIGQRFGTSHSNDKTSLMFSYLTLYFRDNLTNFGYLTTHNVGYTQSNSPSFAEALLIFQNNFNITIDDRINNELLKLIKLPRFGVQDAFNFILFKYK